MSSPLSETLIKFTPEILLNAYNCGVFPMADSRKSSELYWIDPPIRGIIPLNKVHIPRSLRKTIRAEKFNIRIDSDFKSVIEGCAEKTNNRDSTWINDDIIYLYSELFEMGYCHSVEAWMGDQIVGGLYGLSLNGAFFGESMFSRVTDASKVTLIHLVARLIYGKYILLDTQFFSRHLATLGAIKVMRKKFSVLLEDSKTVNGDFSKLSKTTSGKRILQIIDKHSTQN